MKNDRTVKIADTITTQLPNGIEVTTFTVIRKTTATVGGQTIAVNTHAIEANRIAHRDFVAILKG